MCLYCSRQPGTDSFSLDTDSRITSRKRSAGAHRDSIIELSIAIKTEAYAIYICTPNVLPSQTSLQKASE